MRVSSRTQAAGATVQLDDVSLGYPPWLAIGKQSLLSYGFIATVDPDDSVPSLETRESEKEGTMALSGTTVLMMQNTPLLRCISLRAAH